MLKPKAIVVPFGWNDYPAYLLEKELKKSESVLKKIDVDYEFTGFVFSREDVEKAREKLAGSDYDFIVLLIVSWFDHVNAIHLLQDHFGRPLLLWSKQPFMENGVKTCLGAMVASAVLRETFEEMDINFKFIFDLPDDSKVESGIKSFARAAFARRKLAFSNIGLFGYAALNIYTATFDHVSIRKKIGPEILQFDQYLMIERMKNIDEVEVKKLKKSISNRWKIPAEATVEDLDFVARMFLSLKSFVSEYRLNALTVKCHYELSRVLGATPCMTLSMLGDEIICGCEGDIPGIITQYLLYLLSGNSTSYVDIHEILEDRVLIGCCGFAPFSMCDPKKSCISTYGFGGWKGLVNSTPYFEDRKMTIARLASKGDVYKLHFVTGITTEMKPWIEAGCPKFPSAEVILDSPGIDFAQNICSNHYAVVYGDLSDAIRDFCKISSIRLVE